jgi:hypothetical protein
MKQSPSCINISPFHALVVLTCFRDSNHERFTVLYAEREDEIRALWVQLAEEQRSLAVGACYHSPIQLHLHIL